MNHLVGKSTGIALLMAAALLAALFAMGVFSATSVGAHPCETANNVAIPHPDSAGVDCTAATVHTSEHIAFGEAEYEYTVPAGHDGSTTPLELGAAAITAVVQDDDNANVVIALADNAPSDFSITAGRISYNGSSFKSDTMFYVEASADLNDDNDTADANEKVSARVTVTVANGTVISSDSPGAAVKIVVSGEIQSANGDEAIAEGQDITVDLDGFQVPTAIVENRVEISSGGYNGLPGEVSISGDTVTLTVPRFNPDNSAQSADISGEYTITFKQSAGIKNPTSAGFKTITVLDGGTDDDDDDLNYALVRTAVTVDPKKGPSGTEITVTGKGFTKSLTASITVNGAGVGSALVGTGNSFTATLDSAGDAFNPGPDNVISAMVGGVAAQKTATFEITGKVSLDPENTVKAKTITIEVSDWTAGDITNVKIGGVDVKIPDGDDAGTAPDDFETVVVPTDTNEKDFEVLVPTDASTGVQPVQIFVGTEVKGSANLTIGTLALSVSPPTASMGESVTVTGSGFAVAPTGTRDITELGVGTAPAEGAGNIEIISGGTVSFTFSVPIHSNIKQGKNNAISVTAWDNREGTADLMIRKPTITVNPAESRIGSDVTVSGTGFIAGELVRVSYDDNDRGAALADGSGNFTTTIAVPNTGVGDASPIKATSTRNGATTTATEDHSTPAATITVDPTEAQPGTFVTISGDSFQPHVTVGLIEIAGTDVTTSPKPITDGNGAFTTRVLAPFAALGDRVVKVTVGSGASAASKTIFVKYVVATAAPAPTATDEVFADLLESGRLSRVWYLDRANQEWIFYDPRPQFVERGLNELTELPARPTVVTLIITPGENLEFEGEVLYPGTNPIPLN